jgi:hypothetical protein
MRKLLLIGVTFAIVASLVRRLVGPALPRLIESMMEKAMPQMMDACFAQMGGERRRFMLSHCRGLLDQMDAKYMRPQAA